MFKHTATAVLVLTAFLSIAKCATQPNFVIVVTDDQDEVLDGMTPMQNVMKYIANEGALFANSYSVSPVCCPSRASILSGLYQHNHGTVNNSMSGGCYGESWLKLEDKTFAAVLQNNGYETFYAGKYMNRYGKDEAGGPTIVPPGWSQWYGLVGHGKYFNYTWSVNGVPEFHDDYYFTDAIRDVSVGFLQNRTSESPFMMFLAPTAPHGPFTPAPRHVDYYANVTAKRTPNFNAVPQNKHWLMNLPPVPLEEDFLPEIDEIFRERWETLLAVDEMVYDLYSELESQNLLEETYIIFTSDNGYHMGQFSQAIDKRQPYETDIKVPLAIRGPGIDADTIIYNPVINIDLAPTVLSLAGVDIPESYDGKVIDFTEVAESEMEERLILVEYTGENAKDFWDASCPAAYDDNMAFCVLSEACKCEDSLNNTYACAIALGVNKHQKYCKFYDDDNFEEFYDLKSDPYELTNIVDDLSATIKSWYQTILDEMQQCSGASCLSISQDLTSVSS